MIVARRRQQSRRRPGVQRRIVNLSSQPAPPATIRCQHLAVRQQRGGDAGDTPIGAIAVQVLASTSYWFCYTGAPSRLKP